MKQLEVLTEHGKVRLSVISSFTASVKPSIKTSESSHSFMILIFSFISSFEIPFFALATHLPLIFLSNFFIAVEAKYATNPGKLSPAKGVARSAITFSPKLPIHYLK